MSNLFDGSGDSDNELQLNQDYAKHYNSFRKQELLKKYKDRGLDVSDLEASSDSDTSEEDEVLDPKFDEEFFKTLASLKGKNPAIYDKKTEFFAATNAKEADAEDGASDQEQKKAKQAKPVTLKDFERKVILERGGKFEDDTDDDELSVIERAASPTLVEEERNLKAEFKKVLNSDDSEQDEEEFGAIFKKREKTKEEKDKEEEDFTKWLAGKKDAIEPEVKEKLEPLKNYWSNNKLPQSERFLRDYILNKGYADTNFTDIPTYDEIVGDRAPLSEDEEELEKQAEFEQKFNFRFEEPDSQFIQRYPRTIENSVRRTDDKRKQKRLDVKERKKQEKEQKMKELEMIKEMKRKEIAEKIQKLKMVTGNEELGFKDDELEEDFDPEAHDRRMQEIFNDEYYQVDEGEEKPECPSDIEELKVDDWDNYNPAEDKYRQDDDVHCEDEDFNMDCDYDPAAARAETQKELIENTKGRKNRKGRRNPFMEMIQTEKPPFNPEDEKTYAQYIDEYYKMDCEDIIGDVSCRFRYVETTPNDFGLTIEEILLAKNKELNQWASLKKATQIRPDHIEKKEQRLFRMKAKNEDLKRKIFKSLYGDGSDDDEDDKEREVESEGKTHKTEEADEKEPTKSVETSADAVKKSKKKKRKRKAQATVTNATDTNKDANKDTNHDSEQEEAASASKKPKVSGNIAEAPVAHANGEVKPTQRKKKRTNKKKNVATADQPSIEDKTNPAAKVTRIVPQSTTQAKSSNPFSVNQQMGSLPPIRRLAQGSGNSKLKPKFKPTHKFKPHQGGAGQAASTAKPALKRKATQGGEGRAPKVRKPAFKRKATQLSGTGTSGVQISDERLKAYGINPKKFHKKKLYGNNKD